MTEIKKQNGGVLLVSAAVLVAPVLASVLTGLWVFTAIPVGFLFGFFLQKGDLCGASAISEVILFRDRRKVFGLWIAIVVSMLGFAALDLLGLVKMSPKPLLWLSMGAGGLVFGIGTVLAGGCVSGCLYKAGTGNLNSIVALLAIPVGVGMVEAGPLSGLNAWMNSLVVKNADGSPVTVASILGLPFWVVALLVAAATVCAVVLHRRGKRREERRVRLSLTRSWRPWQAGIAIGLLGAVAWISSSASGRNYPLGVTHGPYLVAVLAFEDSPQHVYRKPEAPAAAPAVAKAETAPARPKVVWWLVALVTSLVAGSLASAKLSGQTQFVPRPPEQTLVALLGGLLIGLGAGAAKGCVIGNILSGIGLLSVGTVLFAITTVLGNWGTTYLYLMGGRLLPARPRRSPDTRRAD